MNPDPNRPDRPAHGALQLDGVCVDSYSLEIEDGDGLVGDKASQTAFRELLSQWRERLESAGEDPLGPTPTEELGKQDLDRMAKSGDTEAMRTIALALEEFCDRLVYVIQRFLRQPAWRGVERIVVGGGFKESDLGRLAIRLGGERLAAEGIAVQLRPLHHGADDGGLIGWVHVAPLLDPRGAQAMLAVDIGGTNVRCGIVALGERHPEDLGDVHVVKREIWRHADDGPDGRDLVEGIVQMLGRLVAHAEQHGIVLSPVVGVACPGLIRDDGSIERGAQNLPEDWQQASFHLPRRLEENLRTIGGKPAVVLLHNDAVVQGLSERPFVRDVEHWAVLTIGTGLGNASYTNTRSADKPA